MRLNRVRRYFLPKMAAFMPRRSQRVPLAREKPETPGAGTLGTSGRGWTHPPFVNPWATRQPTSTAQGDLSFSMDRPKNLLEGVSGRLL